MAQQYHYDSWGAYCAHNYWDHAMDRMNQNLLKCMRKLWGSPHEQYWKHHMEKMDNIQNNAYPKLGSQMMQREHINIITRKTNANNHGLVIIPIVPTSAP